MVTVASRIVEGVGVRPVIEHGYCIGCGACASLVMPAHDMVQTDDGALVARLRDSADLAADQRAGSVCPFGDQAASEDDIATDLFPDVPVWDKVGRVLVAYAGHVIEGEFRQRGSSGGMGTWLLEQMLATGLVDGVVHVGERNGVENGGDGRLFGYCISRSIDDLRAGAKSRYYPVTLADVIDEVRRRPGRYAFSGVPCFIKAIRLLAARDEEFRNSVAFCLGLICGHLKSRGFAEFLAWQMGISPERLARFDFRVKIPDRAANRYGALAAGRVGDGIAERVAPMQTLYGQDWGMGLFKPKACDYCDDVVAETADVTVGDAWLPRFVADGDGTNLVVVRNAQIAALIRKANDEGRVRLEPVRQEEVVQSQGSGYAHRREGLAYRLWLADSKSQWRPLKRVAPSAGVHGETFERRHRLRMQLAETSHQAFLEARQTRDLRPFFQRIVPLAEKYRDLSRTPFRRVVARLKRMLMGDPAVRRALRNSAQRQD